ncbi:MAG: HIT domain-containing protein [Bdellovibrionota bacterium]
MVNLDIVTIEDMLTQSVPVKTKGCMFCELDESLIVEETSHFYLIKDKFPISENHVMIISKEHFGCVGELPSSLFGQIHSLREKLVSYFKTPNFIGYEHGRAGHCVKLKGSEVTCHHMHLHYLPLEVNIRNILKGNFTEKPIQLDDIKNHYERYGEYLYFEDVNRQGFFYPAHLHVESHLLRTLVCASANLSHRSDWERL